MDKGLQHYGLNGAQAQGLNGFWKKLWSGVKDVLEFAADVGVPFAGAIVSGMNIVDGGTCKVSPLFTCRSVVPQLTDGSETPTLPLTEAEISSLKFWIDNNFAPFYLSLVKAIDDVLKVQTIEQQLTVVNSVVAKMAFFKAYISTNPGRLSFNASTEQINGVVEHFGYIEKALQDIIMSSNVSLTNIPEKRTSQGLDFQPFVLPTTTLVVDKYFVSNTGVSTNIPVTTPPIVLPQTFENVIVTDHQTNEPKKQNNSWIWWVLGGLAIRKILK